MGKGSELRPPVRWAGGKGRLLSRILPLLPADPVAYAEPFVGGGAVLLSSRYPRALVNDANPDLATLWRVLRDDPEGLISRTREHLSASCEGHYYEVRSWDRDPGYASLPDAVRAARLLFLNRTCYNGLWRVNSKGQMNAPWGGDGRRPALDEDNLRAVSAYLRRSADVWCGDYSVALRALPRGSFAYLDPPYASPSSASTFTSYTRQGFGHDEQVRLRDECVALVDRGVSFLLSNADCDEVLSLYDGFTVRRLVVPHVIGSRASSRRGSPEVLISP